jgi:hypothetical protein
VDDITNDVGGGVESIDRDTAGAPTDNDDGLDNPTHDAAIIAEIIAEGCAAMDRIGEDRVWRDWVAVIAIDAIRVAAMAKANCNNHNGKRYATAFSELLKENGAEKLDRLTKSERSRLYQCTANLEAIERWRGTLTEPERRRLNHPESVWRKFEAATKPPTEPKPESPYAKMRASLVAAQEAQHRAEQALKQIDLDFDDIDEMAAVVAERLSTPMRCREMARALDAKADEMESAR